MLGWGLGWVLAGGRGRVGGERLPVFGFWRRGAAVPQWEYDAVLGKERFLGYFGAFVRSFSTFRLLCDQNGKTIVILPFRPKRASPFVFNRFPSCSSLAFDVMIGTVPQPSQGGRRHSTRSTPMATQSITAAFFFCFSGTSSASATPGRRAAHPVLSVVRTGLGVLSC